MGWYDLAQHDLILRRQRELRRYRPISHSGTSFWRRNFLSKPLRTHDALRQESIRTTQLFSELSLLDRLAQLGVV